MLLEIYFISGTVKRFLSSIKIHSIDLGVIGQLIDILNVKTCY